MTRYSQWRGPPNRRKPGSRRTQAEKGRGEAKVDFLLCLQVGGRRDREGKHYGSQGKSGYEPGDV